MQSNDGAMRGGIRGTLQTPGAHCRCGGARYLRSVLLYDAPILLYLFSVMLGVANSCFELHDSRGAAGRHVLGQERMGTARKYQHSLQCLTAQINGEVES